jgi:hypothetical protein
VAGLIRRDEDDDVGNVFASAWPPACDRHLTFWPDDGDAVSSFPQVSIGLDIGVDLTRADSVDPDVMSRQFQGKLPDHCHLSGFCCGVCRGTRRGKGSSTVD